MHATMKVCGFLIVVSLVLPGERSSGQDDKPFSKRGTLEERHVKLAAVNKAIANALPTFSSSTLEIVEFASKSNRDSKADDTGARIFDIAQAVAHKYPKAYFTIVFDPTDKATAKTVTAKLGKADRTEKEKVDIGGANGPQIVPVTWHFYGWCGYGVTKDGDVVAVKIECKEVPAKKAK